MSRLRLAIVSVSISLLLALAGCREDASAPQTPRSEVPEPLAGEWFTGTLSTFQYYDRTTGEWQNPSGSGFYYILDGDGHYETGAVIDSTVAGCNLRLLGVEVGTVVVDGDQLTIHRHWVRTHVTNSCGNDGGREQGQETRVVTWSVDTDENGLEWLSLVHDDGSEERYRRWTE